MYFVLKCLISGIIVGLVSELAKRVPFFSAIIASLPLTSILALIWLYRDTHNVNKVAELSSGIAWVVLPSLFFFICLKGLIVRFHMGFYSSLFTSCVAMSMCYFVYARVMQKFGIFS